MSLIDELINEHCPDGVPFVALGSLLDYEQPTKYLVTSTAYDNSFPTPVLTAGQTFILGYTDELAGIYPASRGNEVIIFDDFTTAFRWVDFPFKAKSSAMKMLRPVTDREDFIFRFVFYSMLSLGFSPTEHARHWIGVYSLFRIPIPPLEVQREIVRILDDFTQLEAELEAELEARRKQYEHYRNQLLTFPEGGVRWVPMVETSQQVFSGGTPLASRSDYYGGHIPWLRTQEVDFGVVSETSMFITDEGLRNSSAKWVKPNSVIVAMYGATAAKVAVNAIPLTTNQACCNFEIDPAVANHRYVFHWLSSQYEILKSLGQGSQSNLNAAQVKKFPIPLPPLAEQERIVSILDQFDALVNDLSIGLPAELAARRKQYEYYRDKLLTFKELAA